MRSLERLLRPKSIAVIGGGFWCRNVVRECRRSGFDGPLWPIHPTRQEIDGVPAFSSLGELPGIPDAVFVGVNRHAAVELIGELSRRGAGGAVCFASGFREATAELADGGDLQAALVEAAGDMPFLGPNCYGFINALDGAALWPDQHGLVAAERGVALITQSSNIAINLTMQQRALPIAYVVTAGNQAQTGLSEIGEALLQDDRVTAIGLHVEGIDDLRRFETFARKAKTAGKPVVALKVGRSEQAQGATVSHTASLAGSAAGASALFRRLGIAEVRSLPVLLETLKLAHVTGGLPDGRIASMSCSGGEASLIADTATGLNVTFPPLGKDQKAALSEALGPKVALANPLDYHTYIWNDIDAMGRTFAAMMMGDVSLGVVILDIPREDRCNADDWYKVIGAIEYAARTSGKRMTVLSSLAETMPEVFAAELMTKGIVPLCGMEEAVAAIGALAAVSGPLPEGDILLPAALTGVATLSEHEAKDRLKAFQVPVPDSLSVLGGEDAAHAAERIGFPVVLKGTGIAHKSDAGAVALDLNSPDDVLTAAARMPVTTLLVEKMVTGTIAELLVGVVLDPAHGYVLTLGAGGVLTELLKDTVSLTVPASAEEIETALKSLKIGPMLTGYRGGLACDMQAVVRAVLSVQSYVASAAVEEVEINPLLCGKDFAIAADALIRCGAVNDG